MKKFFKLGKRILALFIVVLLNINSYAAVGANDGSAFVTKAEFDALVNTFNEQMDSYQSGLNTKIDGAIANYLAGLSSTQTETRSPLVKPTKGVWSASTTSDLKLWEEGIMKLDGLAFLARWDSGFANRRGGHKITMVPKSSTSFKEHIITNVDSVNKVAQYVHYAKTKQEGVIFAANVTTGGEYIKTDYNSTSITVASFYWITGGVPKGFFTSGGTGDGNNINNFESGAITRDIEEKYIESVILTPTSVEFPYFNLQSTSGTSALWCTDPNWKSNNLHTDKPRFDTLWSEWNLSGKAESDSGSFSGKFKLNVSRYNTGTGVVTTLPFLGFTPDITDWNQLYVDTYDAYADDLVSKSRAEYVTDKDNNKHLTIINGFPLVKAKKDEVIYLPIKFDKVDGEWKNIDIWLKASAFKPDENVKTTTEEDIIKPDVSQGTNLQTSVYSNAVTLNANAGQTEDTKGTGMIKFKMPKDGYVFMKWSVAGNEGKGGGVFHPQDMKVELAG